MKRLQHFHIALSILLLGLSIVLLLKPTWLYIPSTHLLSTEVSFLLTGMIANGLFASALRIHTHKTLQLLASIFILISSLCNPVLFLTTGELDTTILKISWVLLIAATFLQMIANYKTPVHNTEYSYREGGTVKWFNASKGFGFITRDEGDDVFVHYRAIRGEGHRTLKEGERVEFIVVEKEKGLQAEDVSHGDDL